MSCWDRWEVDEKCGASAGNALNLYVAMVLFDDLVHDRQAEAGAFMFAALVLGREERIKNMFEIRFGNALPCVLGFYLHPRLAARLGQQSRPNAQHSALFAHRIQGVEKQVKKHLLDLLTVQHDTRKVGHQFFFDLDPAAVRLDLDEI